MWKYNKGEWSELYAFSYILNSGVLYAADKDLNLLEHIYFPVLKIIREDEEVQTHYIVEDTIKIYQNNELLCEINKDDFNNISTSLKDSIANGSGRTFEIPYAEEFFRSIYVTKAKAASNQKQDMTMQLHDIHTGINPVCSFSVKSYLGGNPTLINAGKNTNFTYTISNCTDEIMEEVNSITSGNKLIRRMNKLLEYGCELTPIENSISEKFYENLQFIDTIMPKFLSYLVLISYKYAVTQSSEVIRILKELNPLNYSNANLYTYKYKKLLCACALGMTPKKEWDGSEDANGGYITVKRNGDVVCYHLYNREEFEKYLFDYTFFERGSSSKHDYMKIFKENDEFKINLNLQIRFLQHN